MLLTLLQEAIAMVVDEELDKLLKESSFFSLMVDESTDIATTQTLIIYVRFVSNGEVTTRFLELAKLAGGTADKILDSVLEVMKTRHLPMEKLFGMATDGASVMTGTRSGVTTRMKRRNPFMLSTHCVAHRLALASGQAADNVPYLKKYQQYINTIYKYYHYSPKHSNTLERLQEVLECAEKKFQQVFHTRWLSFDGAVQAVLTNLDPLFSALISDSSSDPTAKGILTFITTFLFLATTHLLADVLPILARLSKTFQRQCIDFTVVSDSVLAAISAIHGFKHSPGPRLVKFMSDVPSNPGECFYFKEQRISDSASQRHQFNVNKEAFIDKLIENLRSRFPDSAQCTEAELATYGDPELETLCEHFGTAKELENSTELQPVINTDEAKDEWVVFKQFMSQNFRSCTIQTLSRRLYQSEMELCQYPNMSKLITLALTMPVSTVDCERGFSKHNLVKTRIRARLQTKTVSTLMKMSIDTPKLSDMDRFNFSRAFELWCSIKDRAISNRQTGRNGTG